MRRRCDPTGRGLFGCAATARDAKAALLGIRRDTTPVGSWAPVVADVSTHHCLQPLAVLRGWVHASVAECSAFILVQFVCNLCGSFAAATCEPSVALFFTQMCVKAKKLNVSGFPSHATALVDRIRTKLQKSRFLGCSSRLIFLIRSVSSARN